MLNGLIFSLVERSRNQEKICAELSRFRLRSTSESFTRLSWISAFAGMPLLGMTLVGFIFGDLFLGIYLRK